MNEIMAQAIVVSLALMILSFLFSLPENITKKITEKKFKRKNPDKKEGIFKGTWLAIKRISKCHPWHN